jgi:hypothetical protein
MDKHKTKYFYQKSLKSAFEVNIGFKVSSKAAFVNVTLKEFLKN